MPRFLKPSLDWLLPLVPATLLVRWLAPDHRVALFFLAGLGIVPLAGWMGKSTEHLAERVGEGLGGLLNASFGNLAEILIALMALREGLTEVVKASLTGSIVGNSLLVLGMSMIGGGLRHRTQRFSAAGARTRATTLTLAAVALVAPAAFHHLAPGSPAAERELSLGIAFLLLATYAFSLLFALHTHEDYFTRGTARAAAAEPDGEPVWSVGKAFAVLAVATGLVAWLSEILVGSVEPAAAALGMTQVFVGVVVVAVIGNAAEHSTAVWMALEDRMDLSLGIAIGSSVQIALFAAPVLLLASYAIGPAPIDLVFSPPEVLAVGLAVIVLSMVAEDGESNWFEGVQLVAVYLILAALFYFLPEASSIVG